MHRCFLLPSFCFLLIGCGGPYKTASVSGRVTADGKPLPNVAVVFQPVATADNKEPGPGSSGVTDSDGRYTLTIVGKSSRGAVVGKHKVRIMTMNDDTGSADDQPKLVKPARRRDKREAMLEFEVPPGGTDAANFDLKSP